MSQLTICANIIAKEGKIEFVKSELLKLIELTRAEAGCINYDLHQDNESPTHFFFYENWETRELWQAHMQSQHLQHYLAATEDTVESLTVNEMTVIG